MDLMAVLQVNLLPWREKARKIKRHQFYLLCVIFFGVFLVWAMTWHLYNSRFLMFQNNLNAYLQSEIDTQIANNSASVTKTKKKQASLTQLLQIRQLLQQGYDSVLVLNELDDIVPNSIFLVNISKVGRTITIRGNAQTDNDITLFKQVIQNSPVFTQPTLTISSADKSTVRLFVMTFDLKDGQ